MPIPDRNKIKEDLIKLLEVEGSLETTQIYEKLALIWKLTEAEKAKERSGSPLFQHETRWAKQELKIEGVISDPDSSGR